MSITELPQVDELELIPTLPTEPVPRRAVLLRAAELVEEHGYAPCTLGSPEDGFCILGAVLHAGQELGCDPGIDEYRWSGNVVGVSDWRAWGWSDQLWIHPRREGLRRRIVPEERRIAYVLRSLADGQSWEEATNGRGA